MTIIPIAIAILNNSFQPQYSPTNYCSIPPQNSYFPTITPGPSIPFQQQYAMTSFPVTNSFQPQSQTFVNTSPYMGIPQSILCPQVVHPETFFVPYVGAASPLALQHLSNIGRELRFDRRLNEHMSPPSIHFQKTDEGSVLLTNLLKTGKFVLVDAEAFARNVLRSYSRESFSTRFQRSPFEQFRDYLHESGRLVHRKESANCIGNVDTRRTYSICGNHVLSVRPRSQELTSHDYDHNIATEFTFPKNNQQPTHNKEEGSIASHLENDECLLNFPSRNLLKPQGPPKRFHGTISSIKILESRGLNARNTRSIQPTYQRNSQVVGNIPRMLNSTHRLTARTRANTRPVFSAKNLSVDIDPFLKKNGEKVTNGSSILDSLTPPHQCVTCRYPEVQRVPVALIPEFFKYSNVKLTRENYYCKPSILELDKLTTIDGTYVETFEIGHTLFGKVTFLERFDVRGLNLDRIVEFRYKCIQIYGCLNSSESCSAPPVGEELNRPAMVVLYNVYPTHPIRKSPMKVLSQIRRIRFEEHLRLLTLEQYGGTFLGYDHSNGNWTFKVPCFV